MVINMKPMPLKVIGKHACLWTKGLYGLSKDPKPKKHANTRRREELKKTRDFMKVEKKGVHCNKCNGHCMKQWIIIPKAAWTSLILRKRQTCWTSSSKASLMSDDLNDEVPNWTPWTLIPLDGMLNCDGVLNQVASQRGTMPHIF